MLNANSAEGIRRRIIDRILNIDLIDVVDPATPLFVEIHDIGVPPRKATEAERDQTTALRCMHKLREVETIVKEELKSIPKCVEHVFSHDEPGFAYSTRRCVACGNVDFI